MNQQKNFLNKLSNVKNATGSFIMPLLCAFANEAYAEEKKDESAYKTELVYKGDFMKVSAASTADNVNNTDKSVYLGNIDAKLTVDGERALNWPGSTFFLHLLNDHGKRPNDTAGTGQGVDNIEVPDDGSQRTKVFQAWYQQNFFKDQLSILIGLYDLNSEFYVNDAAGLFLLPAMGIGTDISQTNGDARGPSIFPYASFGVRVKYNITPEIYWQFVALDAVPRKKIRSENGNLYVTELAYANDSGKLGIGAWSYSNQFNDLIDATVKRDNEGFYLLAEHALSKNLKGFVRYGVANEDINDFASAAQVGLTYDGLFPSRAEDVIGFGIAYGKYGDPYRSTDITTTPSYERQYELTYRAKITDWLTLQPDLQYAVNDSSPVQLKTKIVGMRVELSW